MRLTCPLARRDSIGSAGQFAIDAARARSFFLIQVCRFGLDKKIEILTAFSVRRRQLHVTDRTSWRMTGGPRADVVGVAFSRRFRMDQQSEDRGGSDQPLAAGEVLKRLEGLLSGAMSREGDEVIFRMSRREHHDLRGWLNSLCLLAYLGEIEAEKDPRPAAGSHDSHGPVCGQAQDRAYSTARAGKD
jgi:hypothetical protein